MKQNWNIHIAVSLGICDELAEFEEETLEKENIEAHKVSLEIILYISDGLKPSPMLL